MSITTEMAKKHDNEPAVLCCRTEAGTVLQAAHLEDPSLFTDLTESGLLTMPTDVLKIGQVLGSHLMTTTDALVPITATLVDNVQTMADEEEPKQAAVQDVQQNAKQDHKPLIFNNATTTGACSNARNSNFKVHIGEGKNITLEIPFVLVDGMSAYNEPVSKTNQPETQEKNPETEPYEIHTVRHDHLQIARVVFGDTTNIAGTTLTLRKFPEDLGKDLPETRGLVEKITVDIITPDRYGEYSDTIMDVQPIAAKMTGEVGEGITRVLDGVVFIVTGTDHNGVQIGEFGSSEGEMDRNIMWNRPGAPDKGEIFIKTKVIIKAKANMERPGPLAAHRASDYICEEIRTAIKKADANLIIRSEEIIQYRRPGKPKVLVVKEIMGQGAMHDNLLLPVEPVGTLGAKPNVDLGNLPIMFSPTEILDGGIHALTCIGPASKETSRHYWREPLVEQLLTDEELDFAGVLLVGSPQANTDKFYVSKRVGMMVEAMDIDGAIVTTEGFGNNHVDFASHMEQIGKRGIKVVGVSYCSQQGALVVGNEYMGAMCDNNKSLQGIENEILANNTLCHEDALRQIAMLKTLMGGGSIKPAERHWNPDAKANNLKIIEEKLQTKIKRVDNEQSLPKSKKRLEKYEPEESTGT